MHCMHASRRFRFVCLFSSLGPLMAVMMGRLMWKCCLCRVVFYFCVFFIFVTDFSGLPWKQCVYSNMRKSHDRELYVFDFCFLYVFVFVVFYIFPELKHKCDSCGCSEVLMCGETIRWSPCSLKPGSSGSQVRTARRLLGFHVCGVMVIIIITEIETDQRSGLCVVMLRYKSSHSFVLWEYVAKVARTEVIAAVML